MLYSKVKTCISRNLAMAPEVLLELRAIVNNSAAIPEPRILKSQKPLSETSTSVHETVYKSVIMLVIVVT